MQQAPIFTLKNVSLTFGSNPLFSDIELYINKGDKISLVGRNGSGKSTLLKIISGLIDADFGEKFIQPGIKIAYMPQEPDFSKYKTLKEAITSEVSKDEEYKADILIDKLGILANQNPQVASGGEKRKTSLAKALVTDPDILLLDEPTNHLDIKTIETLEEIIKEFSGSVVLISHDKMFLSNVTKATFWLDRGTIRRNNKGFAHFEEWQEEVFNIEEKQQEKLNKKIAEETLWLRQGISARRKRNMGRLRNLVELRKIRKEQIKQAGSVNLEIEEKDFRSKLVAEAKSVYKSFGARELIKDFSCKIMKGNKIGIVGPNGSGKSTIIKLLTGEIKPDSGFIRIGKNLEEAYFDQTREQLDPKKTLWKTLCDDGDHIMVQGKWRHVVAYLKDFLFKPDQVHALVSTLSGGERNRLLLALILAQKSNFLILDEPTNDLDMDTLELLQEVLSDYTGTILIVSHDRDFIDKVVTSILYVPGDGSVTEHVGSYSELLEKIKSKEENNHKPNINVVKKNTVKPDNIENKKSLKLSYNQKRLLDILPKEISSLENEISIIEERLGNEDLYSQNIDEFYKLTSKLKNMKDSLEEKENQWLEIEILKEEL